MVSGDVFILVPVHFRLQWLHREGLILLCPVGIQGAASSLADDDDNADDDDECKSPDTCANDDRERQ